MRAEEPWSCAKEEYLLDIATHADESEMMHNMAGYQMKCRRKWWGAPSFLFPALMSLVSIFLSDSQAAKYVGPIGFAVTGIVSGVNILMRYGEKMERHFNYANKYANLSSNIRSELIKGNEYRLPADVMLSSTKLTVRHIASDAPVIPIGILKSRAILKQTTELLTV